MKFLDYLNEMAKINSSLAIHFDKKDLEYLSHFKPASVNVWMYAIMYRYSQKVLSKPKQEYHDITIYTQVDDPNRIGKKIQTATKFNNVPTFTKHLIKKLQPNYDLSKVEIGRTGARKIAIEALAYIEDNSNPIPSLHMNNALKDESKEGRREHKKEIDVGFRHNPLVREPLILDENDKIFLQWFDENEVEDDNGNTRPAKAFKIAAFQKRYSKELINSPNSRNGLIEFIGESGKKWYAKNVPINIDQLKNRLEDFYNKGINFYDIPLIRSSAKTWIENGEINLHKGLKSTKEDNKDIGNEKFQSIQNYINQQNAHLKNPDNVKSPGIWDSDIVNSEQDWMSILKQEARFVVNKIIEQYEQKELPIYRIDKNSLIQSILTYLSSEKIVSNHDYASQKWRINKAFTFAKEESKEMLKGTRFSLKDRKELASRQRLPQGGLSPQTFNSVLNFLKTLPIAKRIPNNHWNDIVDQFTNKLRSWEVEHGEIPAQDIRQDIANEILMGYMPIAAEKPIQAKLESYLACIKEWEEKNGRQASEIIRRIIAIDLFN